MKKEEAKQHSPKAYGSEHATKTRMKCSLSLWSLLCFAAAAELISQAREDAASTTRTCFENHFDCVCPLFTKKQQQKNLKRKKSKRKKNLLAFLKPDDLIAFRT